MFRVEQPSNCGRNEILSSDSVIFFNFTNFIVLYFWRRNERTANHHQRRILSVFLYGIFDIAQCNVIAVIFMKICWIWMVFFSFQLEFMSWLSARETANKLILIQPFQSTFSKYPVFRYRIFIQQNGICHKITQTSAYCLLLPFSKCHWISESQEV